MRAPRRWSLVRLRAVLTSPTWVNAWGKLPTRRLATGSYSSESRPTSLHRAEQALEEGAGLVDPADQGQVVDQPERAGQKRALAPAARRRRLLGLVAVDEAVDA